MNSLFWIFFMCITTISESFNEFYLTHWCDKYLKTTNLNSSDFDFSDEFVEWPLGDLLEDFFLQQQNRIKIMPLKVNIKTKEGKNLIETTQRKEIYGDYQSFSSSMSSFSLSLLPTNCSCFDLRLSWLLLTCALK